MDEMTRDELDRVWFPAYCAALTGLHAFSRGDDGGLHPPQAHELAVKAADLALAEYQKRAVRVVEDDHD